MIEFDAATAHRWSRGAVPGWIPRVALTLAWAAFFGLATALSTGPCPADDPSACGPDSEWALGGSLTLATPVLLIAFPLLGCVAGVLFGLFELLTEPETAARIAFALHGLACAVVLVALVTSRRRQGRIAASAGIRVPVPGVPPRSGPLPVVAVAALLVGAAVALTLWQRWTARDDRHLAAASRVDATVVAEVDDGYSVRLRLPDREDETTVGVIDHYPVDTVVPVFVDRGGDEPWVALVGEQPDDTFPLTAGLAAVYVAAAVGGWGLSRRRAAGRLAAGAPAVTVLAMRHGNGFDLWDTDRRAPFAVLDVRLPEPAGGAADDCGWEDDEWADSFVWSAEERDLPAEEQTRFGENWRSESAVGSDMIAVPVRMTAVGDLRQGGWVALVADDEVQWPARTLRLRANAPWQHRDEDTVVDLDELFRGTPVAAGPAVDLPLDLRLPGRTRLLGMAMLLAFALGPLAAAFLAEDGYEKAIALLVGGRLGFAGLGRLHAGLRLEQRRILIRERFRIHTVPWAGIHGVRRDDEMLRLAWLPDVLIDVGPFAAPSGTTPAELAQRVGGAIMRQRELALAAGDPGLRSSHRLGTAPLAAAVLYAAAILAVLL